MVSSLCMISLGLCVLCVHEFCTVCVCLSVFERVCRLCVWSCVLHVRVMLCMHAYDFLTSLNIVYVCFLHASISFYVCVCFV